MSSGKGIFDDEFVPKKSAGDEYGKFEVSSITIDPLDLNREFQELPPRLSYWNAKLAEASEASMRTKAELERARARAYLEEKEVASAEGRKPTIAELEARVVLNAGVTQAHDAFILAEGERLRLKGIVGAVLSKRDMLQSLGAKLRVEMMADPALRQQLAGASDMELGRR